MGDPLQLSIKVTKVEVVATFIGQESSLFPSTGGLPVITTFITKSRYHCPACTITREDLSDLMVGPVYALTESQTFYVFALLIFICGISLCCDV